MLQALLPMIGDIAGGWIKGKAQEKQAASEAKVARAKAEAEVAQATAFSAAAQLVCDGLALPEGARFQALEDFPVYRSEGLTRDTQDDEQGEAHPLGLIKLTRADTSSS